MTINVSSILIPGMEWVVDRGAPDALYSSPIARGAIIFQIHVNVGRIRDFYRLVTQLRQLRDSDDPLPVEV
jgi:hypothetical protein